MSSLPNHHQLIRPRLRQPHLAGPAEDLAHACVATGALVHGELFGLRVEARRGVGTEIGQPDGMRSAMNSLFTAFPVPRQSVLVRHRHDPGLVVCDFVIDHKREALQ